LVRPAVVLNYIGKIIVFIGIAMLALVICALIYGENTLIQLLLSAVITLALGGALSWFARNNQSINYRETFAVVGLSWIAASLVGSLPFILTGYASVADAVFETVSGFTTTGATIFSDVEALPHSLLFWRSLTHWLGGMGIIVLFVSIIGGIGVRANQLFRAEVTGPVSDKLSPRIRETARFLWITYVFFTVVLTILLLVLGMDLFDALCHAFGTVSTGGFSTKNQSIAYWDSALIQWTITLFMFLCGASFSLHYQVFARKSLKQYLLDGEFRLYSLIILAATFTGVFGITQANGVEEHLRASAFQVVSIITTTGFASMDFDQWTPLSKTVLLILMLIGGCAGSTAGGIKVIRHLIALERVKIEIKHLLHPRATISQKFGDRFIDDSLVINVLQFIFFYGMLAMLGTLAMTALGLDLVSGFTASASCLGNIGPGFGSIGPMVNYGFIPDLGKYLLSLLMLLGRLEIYTLILLFYPDYWR